jgi:hypothetical protein
MPVMAHETQHLQHAALTHAAVAANHAHRHVGLDLAALDAAGADHADIAGIRERDDLHLERAVDVHVRHRHLVDNGLEQVVHVTFAHVGVVGGVAVERRGVNDREVELRVSGAEAVEQIEHLVHHPVRARARAVDLVDDDNRVEAHIEGLLRHEARLRHRAVLGVHQQAHAIDHRQHALDFAAEVGVSWGVDDIDPVLSAIALVRPADGGVLGKDGDAALALEVVAVHDALAEILAGIQRLGLPQQLVHQRGLAVVNVGDDGDVAKVFDAHGEAQTGHMLRRSTKKDRGFYASVHDKANPAGARPPSPMGAVGHIYRCRDATQRLQCSLKKKPDMRSQPCNGTC